MKNSMVFEARNVLNFHFWHFNFSCFKFIDTTWCPSVPHPTAPAKKLGKSFLSSLTLLCYTPPLPLRQVHTPKVLLSNLTQTFQNTISSLVKKYMVIILKCWVGKGIPEVLKVADSTAVWFCSYIFWHQVYCWNPSSVSALPQHRLCLWLIDRQISKSLGDLHTLSLGINITPFGRAQGWVIRNHILLMSTKQ